MLRTAVLTTGIVGVAFAVSAIPAAAKPHQINWKTKTQETKGHAVVHGTWRWQRKYTKHAVKVRAIFQGRLDDKCPGDGFGAYLDMRIYYGDGSSYSSDEAYDVRECTAKKALSVVLRTGWVRDGYKVGLHLYEYDREAGDIAWDDDVQREWFIHP